MSTDSSALDALESLERAERSAAGETATGTAEAEAPADDGEADDPE